jgi:predicted ATPase/DNA-binding SARP family transcriptional activator/tetratricopeptide (TPR) repeat protein
VTAVTGPSVLVLGPVRFADAAGERVIAARRQRSLIAALAIHAGRPVSVSDLVDAVWEDDPPEQARNTLQSYVSRLRAGFGPIVEHGPGGYRLADHVGTDIGDVRSIATHLDRTPPTDPDERARLAIGALERWLGPALGDLRDDLWFAGALAELDELEARLLDIAADALVVAGKPTTAVGLIEARAAGRLAREPTQTLLVRSLHAAGRTAEALRAADRYRTWLRDETGLLPGAGFVEAERAALDGDLEPAPAPRAAVTAPTPSLELPRPTPLVGRDRDLEELAAAVDRGRVVTVTGVGGIGKTRLVAELSAASGDHEWIVVGLAPVEPGGVAAALGARLGYRDDVADPRILVELLRPSRAVLVLDNGEHVIAEVRRLVRHLVDGCPELTVLVTSRSRLDLPDEHVLALAPLDVAGPEAPAVAVFVDRFRRARPGARLDADDPTVLDVCARLDGVPLALELAASRAAVFGLDALARRLDAPIDVLASSVDREGRHATLGNVIEWSVDLLDDPARRVLAALGAFHGTFDVDDAERIAAVVVDEPVAPIVGRLADASLIAPAEHDGEHRLLQMIRHFAVRELERLDVVDRVMEAHARWVASELRGIAGDSAGPDEALTSTRLDGIRSEIEVALAWARRHGRGDLVTAIADPLAGPLLYRPDHELVQAVHAAATGEPPTPDARLLAAGARSAFLSGELTEVETLAHRALDLSEHDPAARHRAAHALGVVRLYQGRFEESRRWFERIIAEDTTSLVDRLDALGGLGLALCYGGDTVGAEGVIAQHRALAELIDSDTYRAFATYMAAERRLRDDDIDAATVALTDATELAWSVGARFVWGIASTVLAAILVRHRPADEARRHLPVLIERWRRSATWPQLWTTLRLVAEAIRAGGHAEVALLVLVAADCDPAAPKLVGDDLERSERLRAELETELGPTSGAIVVAARAIDRVTVLDRAVAALTADVSAAQA